MNGFLRLSKRGSQRGEDCLPKPRILEHPGGTALATCSDGVSFQRSHRMARKPAGLELTGRLSDSDPCQAGRPDFGRLSQIAGSRTMSRHETIRGVEQRDLLITAA